jgi:tetratricopeptide (TPR) repeat protein
MDESPQTELKDLEPPPVLRPRVPATRLNDARLVSFGIAAVCLLCALYLGSNYHATKQLEDAGTLLAKGQYVAAIRKAESIDQVPQSDAAEAVRAYSYAALGRNAAARRSYGFAIDADPNNYLLHRDLAVVLLRMDNRTGAREELGRALDLNPKLPIPEELRSVAPRSRGRGE